MKEQQLLNVVNNTPHLLFRKYSVSAKDLFIIACCVDKWVIYNGTITDQMIDNFSKLIL